MTLMMGKWLKALANVRIFLGISVEKIEKDGASWVENGLTVRNIRGIFFSQASYRRFSSFFPWIFLEISLR